MSTCRICGGWQPYTKQHGLMIRYGIRHSAHSNCALDRWGAAFFDRLKPWQLRRFPYLLAARKGFGAELVKRINDTMEVEG